MTALRFAAAGLLAFTWAFTWSAAASAQTATPAGDATPAGGTFSVRFPVAFKDEEKTLGNPKTAPRATRLLSGATADGVEFSAAELPVQGARRPLADFMEIAADRAGTKATDVVKDDKDGVESLTFTLAEPAHGQFVRMIRTDKAGYALIVQYPTAQATAAAGMKDEFFNSFRIKP